MYASTITIFPCAAIVPVLIITLAPTFGPKVKVPDTVSVVPAVAMAKVKIEPFAPSFNVTLLSV